MYPLATSYSYIASRVSTIDYIASAILSSYVFIENFLPTNKREKVVYSHKILMKCLDLNKRLNLIIKMYGKFVLAITLHLAKW